MRRTHFLVAILTCSIGILSVLVWLLLTPVKPLNPTDASFQTTEPITSPVANSDVPPNYSAPVEDIEIKLKRIKETFSQNSERMKKAEFKITNNLQEWVYYDSYTYGDTCGYAIYKGENKVFAPDCWCGNDLKEREIWQKDYRTLELTIPSELEGNFRIKFEFKVGKKRRVKTVWIEAELPATQTRVE